MICCDCGTSGTLRVRRQSQHRHRYRIYPVLGRFVVIHRAFLFRFGIGAGLSGLLQAGLLLLRSSAMEFAHVPLVCFLLAGLVSIIRGSPFMRNHGLMRSFEPDSRHTTRKDNPTHQRRSSTGTRTTCGPAFVSCFYSPAHCKSSTASDCVSVNVVAFNVCMFRSDHSRHERRYDKI